ncbi:bifunctional UDP-N-acetylglucosamine diphosphorylase/glucosamine-1-phosphate N-acetyltransferase GlmU [Thermosulfuriphilus sp.]
MELAALVLAAGKGTRMKSQRPKVLHEILGRPMLAYVLEALKPLFPRQILVVVGHQAQAVRAAFVDYGLDFVCQEKQLGTGHAVWIALDTLEAEEVLIICGDTPLLSSHTLTDLWRQHRESQADLTFLTAELEDPSGYGRVLRASSGRPLAIVEERDASFEIRKIKEINAGVYLAKRSFLATALKDLSPDNAQGEYYLTDIVAWADKHSFKVNTSRLEDPSEILGVNDRFQLAQVEGIMLSRLRERFMKEGITLKLPETIYLEPSVIIEPDVIIWPGAVIRGNTVIRRGAEIGPGSVLIDAQVSAWARIPPHTIIGPEE